MTEAANAGSGIKVRIGTYAEALAMVGTTSTTRYAEIEVNAAMIQYFCGVAEDANPAYWSEDFARAQWGGLIAPPSMLHSWGIPLAWRPEGAQQVMSLSMQVPLPGDKPINLSSDAEFFRPMRVGDRLNYTEELRSVSEQKRTRAGVGHFVETVMTVRNQDGELIARVVNVLLRYLSEETTG